jgi:diguanylate cyclase (GGDEF)-like protein/PAS domain S-box-containing protein
MTDRQHPHGDGSTSEFAHSLVAAILEASPDGILVVDGDGVIVSLNRRLFDVFGLDPREFAAVASADLITRRDDTLLMRVVDLVWNPESFLARVRELYADPTLVDECEIALKDGRTLERHSTALWNSQRVNLGRVWFFRDITEHKRVASALREIAHHDPLTGASNRRHFLERAAEEFARARRYARPLTFVMLDLDHFKSVNDRFGHAGGDAVLKDLCACARATLRQQDTFARFGGEEFAIMLPETTLDGAATVAERLRAAAEASVVTADQGQIRYTFSAGVATIGPHDGTAEAALQRADTALYEAKRGGRNRVCT